MPLDHPEQAAVIPGARIFTGLDGAPACITFCAPADTRRPPRWPWRTRRAHRATRPTAVAVPVHTGPRNCHDVTAYPAMHLLAAACSSHAIMVDISNPEKPVRLSALTDTNNFQGRHTAGFSNDGKKTIWTDEWGGGTGPMCQAGSIMELGGNTIVVASADNKKLTQHAYFKLPAAQSAQENCVSHNGGLIPVPGRDLYVQGWYQGGVDVMDFTDAGPSVRDRVLRSRFDRSAAEPIRSRRRAADAVDGAVRGYTIGGSWGAYYWNGMIYSSELDRGFDIYELTPSAQLSANEIAAAKLVRMKEYNPQSQPKLVWPAAFPVVRSYLDQLVRNNGLAADRTTSAIGQRSTRRRSRAARRVRAALTKLAGRWTATRSGAKDAARVRKTLASRSVVWRRHRSSVACRHAVDKTKGARIRAPFVRSRRRQSRLAFAVACPEHERPAGCGVTKLGRHSRRPRVELDPRELLGEDLVEVGRVGAGERIDPNAVADHRGVAGRRRARR